MSEDYTGAIIRAYEAIISRKFDLEERYATSSEEVFQELNGSIPMDILENARRNWLVFCADCGHLSGYNADECENCFDHKYAQSEFVKHSRWPSA